MKKLYFLSILLLTSAIIYSQPAGYYNGTDGKEGDELKSALNDIVSGHTEYSYFSSKYIFRQSDADPENPDNVIMVYTGRSHPNDDYGIGGNQLNREHVWAKSHGNFSDIMPMDGDVHNLKPVDMSVNADRSNLDFDNGGTQHPEATGCYYTNESWEPRDEVKGDIARILFYMDTRYEGENGELNLEVVDYLNTFPEPEHGKLSTLLQWNMQDPPDEFEMNRNNVIYNYQKNRNPFIDNPHLANLIWGDAVAATVVINAVEANPEIPEGNEPVSITTEITSAQGSITEAKILYGLEWNNLENSIDLEGSGSMFTAEIPGYGEGQTVHFSVWATDGVDTNQTAVYNYFVRKTFSGTITSIYDIQGQTEVSPFQGQVVSTTGVVTANFGENYYIQDGEGEWNGLFIYDQGRNPGIGDSVIITGTIDEYFDKTEMKNVTDYYFVSTDNDLPEPSLIMADDAGEAYESVLVQIDNATCTDDNYQANFYMWTVTDVTGDLLIHNTAIFEFEPELGEAYKITGPLNYDFDEWKIELRYDEDVQPANDITGPLLMDIIVLNNTALQLEFNEALDEESSENADNYSISNGVTVEAANQHAFVKSRVVLTVEGLDTGEYEITLQGIKDINDNEMETVTVPFSIEDTEAPTVNTVEASSATNIEVHFSEPMDKTSAEMTTNYSVNNSVTVQDATQDEVDESMVSLTVTEMTEEQYELTVFNVKDKAGNLINLTTIPFSVTAIDEYLNGEKIRVYPVPFENQLTVEFSSEENRNVEITLTDISGRVFYSEMMVGSGDMRKHSFNGSEMPVGTYILRISNGKDAAKYVIVKK